METLQQYSQSRNERKPKEEHLHQSFSHDSYALKRRFWHVGTTFDVSDEQGNFLMRARKDPFHLTRRFHVYADKKRENELLSFSTRGSIPETYDITDPHSKEKIGSIKHNPLKSFLRTNWSILSPSGETLGTLRRIRIKQAWNRHGPKALFYPFYEIVTPDEKGVALIQQNFSLVGLRYTMDIADPNPSIDRRLLVAADVIIAERGFEKQKTEASRI